MKLFVYCICAVVVFCTACSKETPEEQAKSGLGKMMEGAKEVTEAAAKKADEAKKELNKAIDDAQEAADK